MKKVLISLFLLIFSNIVYADIYNSPAKLSEIVKVIPKPTTIKCKFKEEKYLKSIQKPVISYGDFEFIENKGVYFYTKYPIQTSKNYTNSNYKQINEIINAISSKKYSKIEKEFTFYYEKNNNIWNLGLKPKKNSKAINYISKITISGEDVIKKIEIVQTNGNKTVICFTK